LKTNEFDVILQTRKNFKTFEGDWDYMHQAGAKYLMELVEGPDLVLQFLKDACSFDRKVMTTASPYSLLKETKTDFQKVCQVFSGSRFYRRTFSQYNVDVHSTRAQMIRKSQYLLNHGDAKEGIRECEKDVEKFTNDLQDCAVDFDKAKAEMDELVDRISQRQAQRIQFVTQKNSSTILKEKIKLLEEEIKTASSKDFKAMKVDAKENIRRLEEEWFNHVKQLKKYTLQICFRKKEFLNCKFTLLAANIKQNHAESQLKRIAAVTRNQARTKSKDEKRYESIKELYEKRKQEVKKAKKKFEKIWKELDVNNVYARQADGLARLKRDIKSVQTQLASYLVDKKSHDEYKKLQDMIEQTNTRIKSLTRQLVEMEKKIKSTFDSWKPKVDSLICKVNNKFSKILVDFDASGEVALVQPEQFSEYALKIKVKFDSKGNKTFRALTSGSFSGGETSAITMIYLLSLQAVCHVPFRIVDEINQGMDHMNERRILELAGQMCYQRQEDGSRPPQMFIFSPTMLTQMPWSELHSQTRFHIIMNGQFNTVNPKLFKESLNKIL